MNAAPVSARCACSERRRAGSRARSATAWLRGWARTGAADGGSLRAGENESRRRCPTQTAARLCDLRVRAHTPPPPPPDITVIPTPTILSMIVDKTKCESPAEQAIGSNGVYPFSNGKCVYLLKQAGPSLPMTWNAEEVATLTTSAPAPYPNPTLYRLSLPPASPSPHRPTTDG